MATLTYLEETYEVNHATKGADFIHAFDKNGCPVVFFDGITDFSGFTYTGSYMDPEECAAEGCNDVKYVNGELVTRGGTPIETAPPYTYGTEDLTPGVSELPAGQLYIVYE